MYIDRLKIENVRGFGAGQVDLSFDRGGGQYAGWTVLAGRNGAGKTTLLRALALAVVGLRDADRLQETFQGWIHRAEVKASASVRLVAPTSFSGDEAASSLSYFDASMGWFLAHTNIDPDAEPTTIAEQTSQSLPLDKSGWFLVGYGPFRRLSGHSVEAQRVMSHSPVSSGLVTLFRDDASLFDGFAWLRFLRLRQADGKPGATELLTIAFNLLNDGLLPDSSVRVERYDSDGLWVSTPRGGVRPVGDLSDGYRAVIALVLDLVRSLHRCYGALPMNGTAVDLPGVVLIDEVDAHLHVSWQQRIGFWLKSHFPRIQFLVTSHSPFVCQAADKNGLILLPEPGTNEKARVADDELYYRAVNGPADAALLSDLFGLDHTWSDESEKKRIKMARLEGRILHAKATAEDRVEYQKLREEIPRSPFETADVDRALRTEDVTPPGTK